MIFPHNSDSTLEEYPIIKIRPDAVGLFVGKLTGITFCFIENFKLWWDTMAC